MWSRLVREEVLIAGRPEAVWNCLTDFSKFPAWNPFILEAQGEVREGAKLKICLLLGRMKVTFRPVVTKVERPRELRWLARVLVPGLFDVDRRFTLQPEGSAKTRFIQQEECTGVLVPLMFAFGLMERALLDGYRQMNSAMKARIDQVTTAQRLAS